MSPNAIQRGVDALLSEFGATGCLREVGTTLLPGLFYDAGSSQDSPQVPANNYAYDMDFDLRPEDRFKLFMSTLEFRGFFLVGVPRIEESNNFGLVYDGTTVDTFTLRNAYDTIAVDAPNAAYDGEAILSAALYKSISDTVADRHGGGVGFDLYLEERGCF